jgi:hypothetical protein
MMIFFAVVLHNFNETSYIDLDNRMWAIFLFSIVSLSPFPEPRGALPRQVSASA